jgi:hypothetical protein
MIVVWSYSTAKVFRQCQRQWFYKNCLANHRAKDPDRREAYLLSKLQSISAWRGRLVDDVISTKVVSALPKRPRPSLEEVVDSARQLFRSQVDYALANRLREPGFTVKGAGEAFAALRPIDYGDSISDSVLEAAWSEIEEALRNFFEMEDLWERMQSGDYLIAQRALQCTFHGVKVRAVPDLIVFYRNAPPLIVDWKVHSFGQRDARNQLILYAIALTRCPPHRDFPPRLSRWGATDVKLIEVQLLAGQLRDYRLNQDDIDDLGNWVVASADAIQMAAEDASGRLLDAEQFLTARDPATCARCVFPKICWEH